MTEEERGARARDVLKEYAYETPKEPPIPSEGL
jgi:hypothetical protein